MNDHPIVKVYGERNTGTNYLTDLLRRNFPHLELLPGGHPGHIWPINARFPGSDMIRELWHYGTFSKNLGWKHTAIRDEKFSTAFHRFPNLNIVFVVKNPYSWLLSLHNRPYNSSESLNTEFREFVAAPWNPLRREHVDGKVKSPAELWTLKVKSYLRCLEYSNAKIVRYEDLLADPHEVITGLSGKFAWESGGPFTNIESSTKGDLKNYEYYKDYYLKERWRDSLTRDDIKQINMHLDREVVRHFGYDLLGD